MKKHFCVYTLLLLYFNMAVAQTATPDWFSIKGFLPEWNGAVVELSVNGVLVQKTTVDKDIYNFTGKTTSIKEALLKINKGNKPYYLPLFIEPGTIKIRDEKQKLVAYGSATNENYSQLIEQFDSLALLQKQLHFDAIKNYKRNLAVEYIKKHHSSLISIKLLSDYFHLDYNTDDILYYQLYSTLDSTIQNSFTGKKLKPEIEQRYATAIGRQTPLLQLNDTSNRLSPIYEKGKYTLINFWASWCLPCRREHPRLSQLYKNYKEQGFTIVSISLDANRAAWLNGVETEKLEWKQLSDLRGWKSPVISFFGVKLIPYNILVDPNGIIIKKNLGIEDVEQVLFKTAGITRFIGPF